MKKLLLLLSLCLFAGMKTYAAITYTEVDGIYYYFWDNTAIVSPFAQTDDWPGYFSNYKGNVVIPETVTYNGTTYSVTSIGDYAFYNCKGLTSVTIPSSVTNIGADAFGYCSGLTSITIPNSVTSIGFSAFSGCSGLTSVDIGNGVTSIGSGTFEGCSSLTSITIPESVTSIGIHAFYDCSSLADITIPNSVTSIGPHSFDETAWYNNQPDGLVYAGKVVYIYKGTMPEGTEITIKEGTLGIAEWAFQGCSGLTSVIIPNSVKSIGFYAFSGCDGLTSVTIPNSVKSVSYNAPV